MQGHKAPAHCHDPIAPVLQPEGLGRAHLADKSDFCRETHRSEWVRSSLTLLPAGLGCSGITAKGQGSKIHEMASEASLTRARLLPGKEELLVHILSRSPIQDVKDRVPLGEQLHLTNRGLPSETVPVSVGPGCHRGCTACWSHSPASAGAACRAGNEGTRLGTGTVTANAQ